MTALPRHTMTVETFLAWAETLPKEAGRFELWDGEVIEKRGAAGSMNAERSQHWEAKAAIFIALRDAAKRSGLPAHVAIDGPTVRFDSGKAVEPDVLVYFGDRAPRDALEIPNPAIVVEVLSPSTARMDLSLKLQGYFSLPSVAHYLILDPDKPLLIHHRRGPDGTIVTRFVTERILRLDELPNDAVLDLDLKDVFSQTVETDGSEG